jgi:hypothetical protein
MRKAIALLGVLVGTSGLVAADALACGFIEYRPVQPVRRAPPKPKAIAVVIPAVDRVSNAELRLDEEKPAAAGAEVVAAFPRIRTTEVGASPLETRALRILALAVARGGGSLAGVRGFSSAADREANLEWAVSTLRVVNATRTDDPVAMADLAEALSGIPKYQAEARGILQDLAARDLMGSAHAYAALARLEVGAGDAEAGRVATGRCEAMARLPLAVCGASDGRLASRD